MARLGLRPAPPPPRRRGGFSASKYRREHPLAGSAVQVEQANAQEIRRRRQQWQISALDFVDLIPEAHYASDFFGDGLGRIRLMVQKDETGNGSWTEVKGLEAQDDPAVKLWATVQDPAGGRLELQAQYGRLVSLANGDGYLVCSWDAVRGRLVWEFLSVQEIIPLETSASQTQRFERRPTAMMADTTMLTTPEGRDPSAPGEAIVWRMWRRDQRFSDEADAPMRGCLQVLEELHLSTLAISSHLKSRLARAGVLFIDDTMTDVPVEATADENPDEDVTLRDFADHVTDPIGNPGSAAAQVPFMWRVSVPTGQKISDLFAYQQLYPDAESIPEIAIRQEAVERFARGIKLPVEVILGMADANHWGGWLIDDMTWQAHLQPEAQRMSYDFTEIFLRPQLRAQKAEDQAYRIWYDASDMVVNPDRSKDAKDCHDRKVISDMTLRDACGFTEDDAPSAAHPNTSPVVLPPVTPGTNTQDKGPPANNAASVGGFLDGVKVMAELRCREKAGARLRAKMTPDQREAYKHVPQDQLAAVLGQRGVRGLDARLGASVLVRGGAEHVREQAAMLGLSLAEAAEVCAEVEASAAKRLYEGAAVTAAA